MTSRNQQTFTYADFVGAIKAISDGKTLSTQQEGIISALNTTIQNSNGLNQSVTELKRQSVTFVTRRLLETGDYSISGRVNFTGTSSFTGTVNLPDNESNQITSLSDSIDGRFQMVSGARSSSYIGSVIIIPLTNSEEGSMKSLYFVQQNTGNVNYVIQLSGSDDFESGSVYKFTIINNGTSSAVPTYAQYYKLNSNDTPIEITNYSEGTPTPGKKALQEITVYKISVSVQVFSRTTFFS